MHVMAWSPCALVGAWALRESSRTCSRKASERSSDKQWRYNLAQEVTYVLRAPSDFCPNAVFSVRLRSNRVHRVAEFRRCGIKRSCRLCKHSSEICHAIGRENHLSTIRIRARYGRPDLRSSHFPGPDRKSRGIADHFPSDNRSHFYPVGCRVARFNLFCHTKL